jgi:glycolate oxidase iron-sulfur subunit
MPPKDHATPPGAPSEPADRASEASAATEAPPGVFRASHPPSADLVRDCVHCGFCLATCPTYVLWGEEMDSPRGRIYLMDLGLKGEVDLSPTVVGHFDKCLGCMACVTACPSGVQYEKLIEATRSQIEQLHPRPFAERAFRRLLFETFPHPGRLRLLAAPLWLYQATGLRRLAHAMRLPSMLPARLRSMEALQPPVSLASLRPSLPIPPPAGGRVRMKVGLLTGCVQSVFFPETNAATARVLAAEGCEVVVPAKQGCCGALMVHAGREAEAAAYARKMIDAFDAAGVDRIVINAAGCGSSMKEYGHLLRDDPAYADRAKAFAAKCRDVTELLVELGEPIATRHPVPMKVAYHDACHLRHAQRVAEEPRRLLSAIPELELCEIDESAICCGSAGIYNLLEPQAATELGDRKAKNILATGCDAVVTGNPGCLLQIQTSLARQGRPLPVLHTVELLDRSLRGVETRKRLSRPRP